MIKLLDLAGLVFLVLAAALIVAACAVAVGTWLALLAAGVLCLLAGGGCMGAAFASSARAKATASPVARVAA
jgi:hypothetical protein